MIANKRRIKSKNPRERANPVTALTICWTLPIFLHGIKKPLDVDELPEPLREHKSSHLGSKLEKYWDFELQRCIECVRKPNLLCCAIKLFGNRVMINGVFIAVSQLGVLIVQPLLLGALISFFSPGSKLTKSEAYIFAFGLILCSMVSMIIEHPYFLSNLHLGMKIRVAMTSLIYRKAMKFNKMQLSRTTIGQVVNLVSNDVSKFDYALTFFHMLWIGPIQTIIIVCLMWRFVGVASVIGVTTLIFLIPIEGLIGHQLSTLRLKTAVCTDQRINFMNEIITGIQVIKMYTWELPFSKLIYEIRRKEISFIKKSSNYKGILLSLIMFYSRAAVFVTILSYVLLGHQITAEKIFVVYAFYNVLRQTMTIYIPLGVTETAEALVSISRVQNFLMLGVKNNKLRLDNDKMRKKDGDKNKIEVAPSAARNTLSYSHVMLGFEQSGVVLDNVTAKWSGETMNTLHLIDIELEPGQLTVITGKVGAGKSSLFYALMGELELESGLMRITGKISYASQEPWLFHESVRQNILFGEPFDQDRYKRVITVCALKQDLDILPRGDLTVIGERGTSLSGGQKARVNLARAVYRKADIYLLDDPLSAVDSRVSKHLFYYCIKGFLREKIVVLITHQTQFLETVNQIVVMENGKIVAKGAYKDLQALGIDDMLRESEGDEVDKYIRAQKSISVNIGMRLSREDSIGPEQVAEKHHKGGISCHVYAAYLKSSGGYCNVFFVFFMCALAQVFASTSDYWITYWINLEEHAYNSTTNSTMETSKFLFVLPRNTCIYIFSALTVATVIVAIVRSCLFFDMCMRASRNLHKKMFDSMTKAKMLFFNTNPSGRILNRFSKDLGIIDDVLPMTFIDVVQIFLNFMAIMIVVALVNPWLLIPAVVCGLVFFSLRAPYIKTSRNIKRLEAICEDLLCSNGTPINSFFSGRSPVFTHLSSSLQGQTTIRAFNAQQILINEFDNHQDLHSSAWYYFIATGQAFGFWLDIICSLYLASITLSFLIIPNTIFGGNVGLAITQAISLTGMLQWGVRQTAEVENEMTSAERIIEYSKLESETPLESKPGQKPSGNWPTEGKVSFENVSLRYAKEEPWVLKGLTFTVEPKEKIGIVGRTGAGKSSIISALFRLSDLQGEIIIDGIDTSTIGLHDLRSKISIIPQEPFLYCGSLRNNLDPFDQYSDDVLWKALEDVQLKKTITELPGGLLTELSEGGSNLSVGQRQLVCLARAIIRNNKLLVLDEATANVDPKTDLLIQDTIRQKFAECTVLTIAHRLNTIMDSDKLIVMDAGQLVEFDHPHNLLSNTNGLFYNMVEQVGQSTRDALHSVAAESYSKSHLMEVDEENSKKDV